MSARAPSTRQSAAPARTEPGSRTAPATAANKAVGSNPLWEALAMRPASPAPSVAPPDGLAISASAGQPLPHAVERGITPVFGPGLPDIRVHDDARADRDARALGAKAFTFGQHIAFRAGEFRPTTEGGQRLIAHEVAHVAQQAATGQPMVQRFVECGDSADCPAREAGELTDAMTGPMFVGGVTDPNGMLVGNFAVGSAAPKRDLASNTNFTGYAAQMLAHPQSRFEIRGFTDCEGDETHNAGLRAERAQSLLAALPAATRTQVTSATAAPLSDCMDSNATAEGRALNRSAFLMETGEVHDFPEERVTATPGAVHGITSPASEFFVRASPGSSGRRLGMLALRAMEVEIVGESGADVENLWFEVRFTPTDFELLRAHLREWLAARQAALPAEIARLEGYIAGLSSREDAGARRALAESRTRLIQEQTGNAAELAALEGPAASTTGWVKASAFAQVALPYDQFVTLLDAFDAAHAREPLRDRLTRLRQIGEDASLRGDEVVGRGDALSNPVRQGDRANTAGWQLLLETKQIVMPNMEVIDIHHFILGLDALALPASEQSSERTLWHYVLPFNLGESYSAATWSGDVGGAVGDYVAHKSSDWEAANTRADNDLRRRFYFDTRAPAWDLLADIDAWGAFGALPTTSAERTSFTTLRQVIEAQYGAPTQTAEEYERTVAVGRRAGIATLLCWYGFTSPQRLRAQSAGVAAMRAQVSTFGISWYRRQAEDVVLDSDVERRLQEASDQMTGMFLDWLEALAREQGLTALSCPTGDGSEG